jgi:hypothetical protein
MALNGTGPISFGGSTAGQSINLELGQSATAQISLNDTNVRSLAGKASGAVIVPTDFYGKAVGFTFNRTLSTNTANYNLRADAVASGWNQTTPLIATVTISTGVYVYSTSTGAYAFQTGNTFPAGSSLRLINNGTILGMGGNAGAGPQTTTTGTSASAGAVGGPALLAQYALAITNNGVIGGGGGGGGGGSGN